MNSAEYKKITDLLKKNNIEELNKYLETKKEEIDSRDTRQALNDYIKDFIFKEYPSYYRRVVLKQGTVEKSFRGLYKEIENGFMISRDDFSVFRFNDIEILTPSLKEILERSNNIYGKEENKKRSERITSIEKIFDIRNKKNTVPVVYVDIVDNCHYLFTAGDKEPALIPSKDFVFAENLLGSDVEYFVGEEKVCCTAVSKRGKALIMGLKNK